MHIDFPGMVAICCGCDGFTPWTACLVGAIGSVVHTLVSVAMIKLKIDDPIDAVAVHGGGGKRIILFVCLFLCLLVCLLLVVYFT